MFAIKPWTRRTLLPRAETPFRWMPEEFGKMLEHFFTRFPIGVFEEEEYPWGVTVEELESKVVVRVELPGFEPAEVKVEVIGETLTVEAEHRETEEEKGEEKAERAYAHVKRVVTLPAGVEAAKAEAALRNGILEIHLPRKPEARGRRIEVKA